MPLTLTIRNATRLDNGSPVALVLDRRGAIIGRAATSDWCLPDPTLFISSRHCEVKFADGRYELLDHSTNGTFVHGQAARLSGVHGIAQGDVFVVGSFEIVAALDEAAAAAAQAAAAAPPPPEWKGWAAGSGDIAASVSESAWDKRPTGAAITGGGAMSQAWAPPAATSAASAPGWGSPPVADAPAAAQGSTSGWGAPPTPPAPLAGLPASVWSTPPASPGEVAPAWGAVAPAPVSAPPPSRSTWDVTPPPAVQGHSEWSSDNAPPPPPSGDDIWGKFTGSNVVDWARGGFGKPSEPVAALANAAGAPSAWGSPAPAPVAPPAEQSAPPTFAAPASAPPPAPASAPAPGPASAPSAAQAASIASFAQALGLPPERLQQGAGETIAAAGNLLRRLVAGLVVMLEARTRAKSQLGAQGTSLEFAGNNPLKFARTPDQALAQLLNAPERGFMGAEQAIEDAFKDLQAHQMATLLAMQGALRGTLDRFSPKSIRSRAETGGFLKKILPGARDAALWNAYEREFSGVAQGSDEAFMDVFAREFKRAYEEAARK